MRIVWEDGVDFLTWHEHTSQERDRICHWLRDQGLDPFETIHVQVVADGDGQVIAEQYVKTPDGRYAMDLREPRRRTVTVPLRTPPPVFA